jgi:hypothetical protein
MLLCYECQVACVCRAGIMVAPLFEKPRTYNIEGGVASEVGLRRAICPVHSGAMALRCPGDEMTRAAKKCTSLIYKSEYYKW